MAGIITASQVKALVAAILSGLIGLVVSTQLQAEVYRTTDANGNVIFTDQNPRDGKAETIEISPVLTIPATPVRPVPQRKSKDVLNDYSSVDILSPDDQQSFQNPQVIEISARTMPSIRSSHSFRLLLDGENIQESHSPNFTLEQPARGSHTLQVQVIDEQGKVLISSPSRTIFVHRPSALFNRKPRPGDPATLPVL